MTKLTPFALRDAPALIETVFPVQKVSWEAQKERKAGAGQTLTTLGSYWKGRKPLILVRACILGLLLPSTDDPEQDLLIYEMLMGFDINGLAKRALEQKKLSPKDIAAKISHPDPTQHFVFSPEAAFNEVSEKGPITFPLKLDELGLSIRWKRDVAEEEKIILIAKALATFPDYFSRAKLCKRPEEVDQTWLYNQVWPSVNKHYKYLGVNASSHQDLVEQLGILRFGERPKVGDTFCGGGSIPFEAARLGCDVNASDLNPIACMLTWCALNIIGAQREKRNDIEQAQKSVAKAIDAEICALGIEHDTEGNRAKAYLYCLETRCPETGWMVPMAPNWIISKTRNVVAKLVPIASEKRFSIEIHSGVSKAEMKLAEQGTIRKGSLNYEIEGKHYSTPIKTLRGDYKDEKGANRNRLRQWKIGDFKPASDDVFQERLYAIQWIDADTIKTTRPKTFFRAVSEHDIEIEERVDAIVSENLTQWQAEGLVPDMAIEPGYNTDQPIRERGWTYWHHLYNARQLLFFSLFRINAQRKSTLQELYYQIAKGLDRSTKLCRWTPGSPGKPGVAVTAEKVAQVFDNQALNTFYNYSARSTFEMLGFMERYEMATAEFQGTTSIKTIDACQVSEPSHIWMTDPPYADAVHYHEITEFFISWLRKNPPGEFNQWTWDSRRAFAIKGSGDDFRRGMVEAYSAMAKHMPDNGRQCVMFTHQDAGVWSDMVGIFWAAGLQVTAAWYIATETSSELKKGGYVQGTVTLLLRKRPSGERHGFRQELLPAVRAEVKAQIEQMMNLNDDIDNKHGEPVFNDSDLQMAGYAAALKVLTGYTHVDGEDVTGFTLRPRRKGETTVVDAIVQQASEAANSLLVPEGLSASTWGKISGVQRFYFRMLDMETTGARKLDNYQNFAKAFRVADYSSLMASIKANEAALKQPEQFTSRELGDSTELGATWLGRVIVGIQQVLAEVEPQTVVNQMSEELPAFLENRLALVDLLRFLEKKTQDANTRDAAELLANQIQNRRVLGQ